MILKPEFCIRITRKALSACVMGVCKKFEVNP